MNSKQNNDKRKRNKKKNNPRGTFEKTSGSMEKGFSSKRHSLTNKNIKRLFKNKKIHAGDCNSSKSPSSLNDNDIAITIRIPPKSLYVNININSQNPPPSQPDSKFQPNKFLDESEKYENCVYSCNKTAKDSTLMGISTIFMETDIDCEITINTVSPDVLVKEGLTVHDYIIFMSSFKKDPDILIKGIKRRIPLNYTFKEFMDCFKLFLYIFLKKTNPIKKKLVINNYNNVTCSCLIPIEIFSVIEEDYNFDIRRFLSIVGNQKDYCFDYNYDWVKEFDLSFLPNLLVESIRKGIKGSQLFSIFSKYEPDKLNLSPQCEKVANIIKNKLKLGFYWEMHPFFIKNNEKISKLSLKQTLPNLILDCFREKTINLMIEKKDLDYYPVKIMDNKLPEGTINYNKWDEDTFSSFNSLILKAFWKNKK